MRPVVLPALLGLALGLGFTACSSGTKSLDTIAVTSSNNECKVAQTAMAAGKHTFQVENTGSQVTEVYVYATGDKVLSEKENIGPGTKASFSVTLAEGQYLVACKPGQTGTGIRQPITVN